MEVFQHFHMNGGTGETSYSSNSFVQRKAISITIPIIEEAILETFSEHYWAIPKNIGIADMGCSSGPNALLVVSYLMDTINNRCRKLGRASPEFLVFLNDLPGNDFNTIFRSLQDFYDKLKETEGKGSFKPHCFVAGLPGTFYGRLFPSQTLHFVHSSYSLHWLSQVPLGIDDTSNKGNIYLAKSSPPTVVEAYLKQFQKDFGVFLRSRSEELVKGGCMVLTLLGRSIEDPCNKECCCLWDLLAGELRNMAVQGFIEEEKLDSFNLPHYKPSLEEVKSIIQSEGSFIINRLDTFEVNWDGEDVEGNTAFDKFKSSNTIANCIRAASESLLATHFGIRDEKIDELFRTYREIIAEVPREKTRHLSLVVSLKRA